MVSICTFVGFKLSRRTLTTHTHVNKHATNLASCCLNIPLSRRRVTTSRNPRDAAKCNGVYFPGPVEIDKQRASMICVCAHGQQAD